MGTSTNQASPRLLPNWRIPRASLGTMQVPIERQASEIWKSASADRDGALAVELSSASMRYAAQLAATSVGSASAVRMYDDALDENQNCGVIYDIARRALIRATTSKSGAEGFAQELFVETANYYVSRDLPSVVAAIGRVATTSEALEVKDGIRNLTRRVVAPLTSQLSNASTVEAENWQTVVGAALSSLRVRGQK